MRRVTDVSDVSRRLLGALGSFLREQGCHGALVDPDGLLDLDAGSDPATPVFKTLADATMWCEDGLIGRYGEARPAEEEFQLRNHPLLMQVPPRVVDELERRLQPRHYADGELIVAEGDAEAGVFLIMCGRVRSSFTTASGATRSLATLTPGTCFGDVYVVTDNPHPLSMYADGPVELVELTREEYTKISKEDPELWAGILYIFMFAIRDDLDRALRSLATGRVAVR